MYLMPQTLSGKRGTLRGLGCPGPCRRRLAGKSRRRLGAAYNSATNFIYVPNSAAAQNTASGMISEGYSGAILSQLIAQGATANDLQNLWDNYSPTPGNPDYFGPAAVALMQQIANVRAPGAGGGSVLVPGGTNPIVNTAANAALAVQNSIDSFFSPSAPAGMGFSIPWWGWVAAGFGAWIVVRDVL
jgi:hypothetical protein